MADLSAAQRKRMKGSDFALSGHRFPINDETHARLAISGASRAEHAGNITEAQRQRIVAKARKRLGALKARHNAR